MERIIAGRFPTKGEADAAAMGGIGDAGGKTHASDRRPGGVILSVRIATPVDEKRVIAVQRAHGAADIERADGLWRDGDWTDFKPVAAPQLVTRTSS